MLDENPIQVQYKARAVALPLFLIHDGGGTVFNYLLLDDLDRWVYGIHNPHFGTDETWPGGITEMAAHYCSLIASIRPKGDILLGGWSLGGMVSIACAHIFITKYPKIKVRGIVMIDSPNPNYRNASPRPEVPHTPSFLPTTKQEMRDNTLRSFAETRRMLREWTLPTEWETPCPPATLLKAIEPINPIIDTSSPAVTVDNARDDPRLGWGQYQFDPVTKVVDIPGNHFSLFEMKHLDTLSKRVKEACDSLEASARR